jgi:glycerol-3-phosphate dehydrogenase (NAD(P)+)
VGIVGAGAWGTALAHHLGTHGVDVRVWAHQQAVADALEASRENALLPGVRLPDPVRVSHRLGDVVSGASLVVLAVPSHVAREVVLRLAPIWPREAMLVSATKGMESDTLKLISEVATEVLGRGLEQPVVVLSGPSFAREVAQGQPTSVVAACTSEQSAVAVQRVFSLGRFRVYTSKDPVGVQVAGALKNVIAIAVGASDGLGFGDNARAALVTRGLSEIARVAVAKGGEAVTVSGLAGLGDLVLTCTGNLSRNRTVGFELGRGRPLAEVLSSLGHVAEGVTTARSADVLARSLGVDLPICAQVHAVLCAGKTPLDAVDQLLRRRLKRE